MRKELGPPHELIIGVLSEYCRVLFGTLNRFEFAGHDIFHQIFLPLAHVFHPFYDGLIDLIREEVNLAAQAEKRHDARHPPHIDMNS